MYEIRINIKISSRKSIKVGISTTQNYETLRVFKILLLIDTRNNLWFILKNKSWKLWEYEPNTMDLNHFSVIKNMVLLKI